MSHDDEFFDEDYKSKTQIKQELLELTKLGANLIDLPLPVYESFPIPEDLNNAIEEARRIKSNNAKKRQIQFIGKIIRNSDHEAIQKAYDEYKSGRKALAREFQRLEKVRDQLIESNKATLDEVIQDYPDCDIQHLRQLIRQAQQEKKANKPPKFYRKLFKYLRELHEAN